MLLTARSELYSINTVIGNLAGDTTPDTTPDTLAIILLLDPSPLKS